MWGEEAPNAHLLTPPNALPPSPPAALLAAPGVDLRGLHRFALIRFAVTTALHLTAPARYTLLP